MAVEFRYSLNSQDNCQETADPFSRQHPNMSLIFRALEKACSMRNTPNAGDIAFGDVGPQAGLDQGIFILRIVLMAKVSCCSRTPEIC